MAESLAVLLLPTRLEEFEFSAHARDLLAIPRVVALEPPRVRLFGFMAEAAAIRQVRRLRFPGEPRVIVLYDAGQYPLARALCSRYEHGELWYVRAGPPAPPADPRRREQLLSFDELAMQRARSLVTAIPGPEARVEGDRLRQRLIELEVISPRPFVPPGARVVTR